MLEGLVGMALEHLEGIKLFRKNIISIHRDIGEN
jgi:hypothetical protein